MSRALSTLLAVLFLLATAAAGRRGRAIPSHRDARSAGEVVPGEVVVKWRERRRRVPRWRTRTGLAVARRARRTGRGPAHRSSRRDGRSGRRRPRRVARRSGGRVRRAQLRRAAAPTRAPIAAVAGQRPEDGGPVLARPDARARRVVAHRRAERASSPSSTPACRPTTPTSSAACCRGYDFVNNDTNAADDNGHGTWVAGIIAANPNDGYGIAGISWSDKILPVKIMSGTGTGDTADLTAGHHLGGEPRRDRHQHERRRLPARRSTCRTRSTTPGTRASSWSAPPATTTARRPSSRPASTTWSASAPPRSNDEFSSLVELRPEGRRQRARAVGPDHELHRLHLRGP